MRKNGFTFIEVLLTVAIIGIITTLIWASFYQSIRAKDYVEQEEERYHGARLALQRMADEISMAFLTRHLGGGAGPIAVKTVFKGERGNPVDALTFSSFSHLRLRKDAREGDTCHIRYYGESSEEAPGTFNLMRRESPRLDDEPGEKGQAYVAFENVKSFKIRFYNPDKNEPGNPERWEDEWDTESPDFGQKLPGAVHIRLVFIDQEGRDVALTTVSTPSVSAPLDF